MAGREGGSRNETRPREGLKEVTGTSSAPPNVEPLAKRATPPIRRTGSPPHVRATASPRYPGRRVRRRLHHGRRRGDGQGRADPAAADFFREVNAWTFEACRALWDRHESINQVTVAHELDRRGRLEDVGGLTYLSELILNLPTPVGVEHFAGIVKRDATYRQMIDVATTDRAARLPGRPRPRRGAGEGRVADLQPARRRASPRLRPHPRLPRPLPRPGGRRHVTALQRPRPHRLQRPRQAARRPQPVRPDHRRRPHRCR